MFSLPNITLVFSLFTFTTRVLNPGIFSSNTEASSFKYGNFEMFIVLDNEGAIVTTKVDEFILGTEHYDYSVSLPSDYFTKFEGVTEETFVPDSALVAQATYSSTIVKNSLPLNPLKTINKYYSFYY